MTHCTFEQKEDIRVRMAELEKKLAESEEERCKLEKTCNVLMRAFREEEKMHYKALNKKYEKFLEDCSVRRRRNDIILRSLCRIEDRSRALFAKTERLKLLKDRYISCLKINRFREDEVSSHFWKNFPFTSRDATHDVTTKSVRWKTPLALGLSQPSQEEFAGANGDFLSRNDRLTSVSFALDEYGREKSAAFQDFQGPINLTPTEPDLNYPIGVEVKSEEFVRDRSRIMREATVDNNSREFTGLGGVEDMGHLVSVEKSNKGLSEIDCPESESPEPKSRILPENDDIEPNETDPAKARNKSFNELPRINHYVVTSSLKSGACDEEYDVRSKDVELSEENDIPRESLAKTENDLPLGLDGVDYQNETYPESYYEQPVHHHNHLSIASDVILEEDETEQDVDEEEKDLSEGRVFEEPQPRNTDEDEGHGAKTWEQPKSPKGHSTVIEPQSICGSRNENEPSSKGYLKNGDVEAVGHVRSQVESESEKSSEGKRSAACSDEGKGSASERAVTDMSEKTKGVTKSNLIHMLESDSESFQIEHGDGGSGNEDSDFDFSFNKN